MQIKNITVNFLAVVSIFLTIIFASMFFIAEGERCTILINTNEKSPVAAIGGYEEQERIYLRFGAIYALKDDAKKEYQVVDNVFHVTNGQLKKMVFFDTLGEAEAAGYKPSEDFAKDYECVKQRKGFFECD